MQGFWDDALKKQEFAYTGKGSPMESAARRDPEDPPMCKATHEVLGRPTQFKLTGPHPETTVPFQPTQLSLGRSEQHTTRLAPGTPVRPSFTAKEKEGEYTLTFTRSRKHLKSGERPLLHKNGRDTTTVGVGLGNVSWQTDVNKMKLRV